MIFDTHRAFWSVVLALSILFLGGCDDPKKPDAPVLDERVNAACVPDAALIAEGRECRRDDHCPCGAHCSMGLCTVACSTNADCDDGASCDIFGRCRQGDLDRQVVSINSAGEGKPRILQRTLARGFQREPRLMTVVADDGPISRMRIVAEEGAQIALPVEGADPEDLEYVAELVIEEPVEAGNGLSVFVRPTEDMVEGEEPTPASIMVVTESNTSVTVPLLDPDSDVPLSPVESPALEGVYEGFARLTSSGMTRGRAFSGRGPERNVSTLLSAEVFPAADGRAVIVLRDSLRLLLPSGRWAGELILDENPRVEMPPMEQFAPGTIAGGETHAVVVALDGELSSDPLVEGWSGVMTFNLELQFEGVSGVFDGPSQVWSFGLSRAGDLPDDASNPGVDEAAVLGLDPRVEVATPLPREAAFLQSVNDTNGFGLPPRTPGGTCGGDLDCSATHFCTADRSSGSGVCLSKEEIGDAFPKAWLRDRAERSDTVGVCTDPFDAVPVSEAERGADLKFSLCGGNRACVLYERFTKGVMSRGASAFHTSVSNYGRSLRGELREYRGGINLVGLMGTWLSANVVISNDGAFVVEDDDVVGDFDGLDLAPSMADFNAQIHENTPGLATPIMRSVVNATTLTKGASAAEPKVGGVSVFLGSLDGLSERPMWTLQDGSSLDFALPCALDLSGLSFEPIEAPEEGYGVSVDSAQLALDECAALSEVYDCAVFGLEGAVDEADRVLFDSEEDSGELSGFPLNARLVVDLIVGGRFSPTLPLTSNAVGRTLISKVCVFPTQPAGCAEASLCNGRYDGFEDLLPDPLDGDVDFVSGDLLCADNGLGLVQPMDVGERKAGELRDDCVAALDALDTAPSTTTADFIQTRLADTGWFDMASCLNPQRFVAQLAVSGAPARQVGTFDSDRASTEADLIFMRLLQRYFQTAHFIVADAASGLALEADAASTLDGGTGKGLLEDALERSLGRWELVMLPRIGASLSGLSAASLAEPDYRLRVLDEAPPADDDFTQAEGVVVAMMQLLATQMELMEQIVDRHARSGARDVPAVLTEGLRTAVFVESLVNGLTERAIKNGDGVPVRWLPLLGHARSRFETARSRVLLSLNAVLNGSNPLGIEDDDLPLYFSEIESSVEANYTAISRYIVGTVGINSGVAINAVERAKQAAEVARASRRAEEERDINFQNNEADLEEDIRANKRALGEQIEDYCGITLYGDLDPEAIADLVLTAPDVSAPMGGKIDFGDCWFLSELSECKTDEELDMTLMQQDAVNMALAQDELVKSVEANMRNDLCVATLSASIVEIEADDPDFEQRLSFEGFNLQPERDAVLWTRPGALDPDLLRFGSDNLDGCFPPRGNKLRLTGGSKALRNMEEILYDPEISHRRRLPTEERRFLNATRSSPGDSFTFSTSDFVSDSENCGSSRRVTNGPVSIIPYGEGTENVCGVPGPGGLFFDVEFVPGGDENLNAGMKVTCQTPGGALITQSVTNEDMRIDELADPEKVTEARKTCRTLYPRAFTGLTTDRRDFEITQSFCFRGALGAQGAALRSLVGEIESAQSELSDLFDAYNIEKQSCYIQQEGNEDLRGTEQDFAEEINRMRFAKVAVDAVTVAANELKDCLATLSGVAKADLVALKGGGALAAGSCAAGAASAKLQTVSLVLEAEMERLEDQHNIAIRAIEAATEEQRCFKEAELALVGQRTQDLRIQLAIQELENGYAAFINEIERADSEVKRGIAGIATARRSGTATVNADSLLGRDQKRANVSMRIARRATYLAVRAVEYEFQQSLGDRGTVLTAENPDVLEDVIENLRSFVLTGRIGSGRPRSLTEVFSLRRHLLQLSPTPEGGSEAEHNLTEEERFRQLLQDPRFEVFEDGEFVGREIPFLIAPLEAFGLGEVAGVPIVSDSSCGERLWSVNVSPLGDPETMYNGFTPQVNMRIRKNNTFFANWCGPNEEAFQVASVRPSKNLFREPGVAEGYSLQGGDETKLFSEAQVQALLNIQPGEFVTDAFVDGASTELAGRLLFGEYALFIPATSIARVEDGEPVTEGLLLGEVDDIAIRIDYLSVAR